MSIQSNFPAIKPSLLLDFANTKQLDPRVTFARATTATYYDGVTTAKAEENLITYSQEFDNAAWTKREVTISANSTTAPDGTSTADTITPTTANEYHFIFLASTPSGATNACFSVYAKANGYNNLFVRSNTGGTYRGVNFNVSTGVVSAVENGVSGTITSVGNGWYRCSVNFSGYTITSETQLLVNQDATSSLPLWSGNGTSGIFIWGAQIESNRSLPTAYTATTTQPITNYIPVLMTAASGVPRFDHNPTTDESLGLLIEEGRTNQFFPSEGRTSWSTDGTGSVLLDSATINPAGQAGGWIYKNTGYAYLNWGSGISAGTWTYSVYIKKSLFNTTNVGRVSMFTPSVSVDYNFGTGAITLASGSPVSYGCQRLSDTMARVWITVTITGATLGIGAFDTANNSTLLWGLQIESGSFPTSYIPTVASAVTRNVDSATMTGTSVSSWFSADQGASYSEFSVLHGNGVDSRTKGIFGNGSSRFLYMNGVNLFGSFNGSSITQSGTVTTGSVFKGITAYSATENIAASNNQSPNVNNVGRGNFPNTTTVYIGNDGQSATVLNGHMRKLAYYPMRLTNAQLQALTS